MSDVKTGTFMSVTTSMRHTDKVEKRLRFPLGERTLSKLRMFHECYAEELGKIITVPRAELYDEKRPDGRYHVTIIQDDLGYSGILLADYMRSRASRRERLATFGKALGETLKVYERCTGSQMRMGIESDPHNWWLFNNGRLAFFDTMPPLLSFDGYLERDVLVLPENPTRVGRLSAFMARFPLTSAAAEGVMDRYAFHWPTTVRTFLVKAIECAPDLTEGLVKTARQAVEPLGKEFTGMLSACSVWLEMQKLRIYRALERAG